MKILLISPVLAPSRVPEVYNIGLGYVGAALLEAGYAVTLLDIEGNRYSEKQVEEYLQSVDFEVAAIGTLITGYKYTKWLTNLIRKVKPNVKIWIGNSIGTTIPELILRDMPVDVVVIGEGEITAKDLADVTFKKGDLSRVKGIAYLQDGKIQITPGRELVENLDSLPKPAWDLFNQDLYMHSSSGVLPSPRAYVISTRGCPYQCTYCYHPFLNQKIRSHSPARVVEEIRSLKSRYHIRSIYFGDDLFIVDKARVREICRLLIEDKVDIRWMAQARVNTVDPDLLKLMKKAGCVALGIGVESASPLILANIKKNATAEQASTAIKMCREAGIIPACSFMIGNVGETQETVNETVDFMIANDIPPTSFFYATPYPATELYSYAREKGLITDEIALFESYSEQAGRLLVNFTCMSDKDLVSMRQAAEDRLARSYRKRHPYLWFRDTVSFLVYYAKRFGFRFMAQKVAARIAGHFGH